MRGKFIFAGFVTDFHSHILPGADDGVRTIEDGLEILRLYEGLGVRTVWLTPHIMEDIPNTTAGLKARFEELKEAYSGPVVLRLASENMLDNLFEEHLESGDLLPLDDDLLLVETSYFNPPMNLEGILRRIMLKGLYPVLAHPERYVYMDKDYYCRLKEMGVEFQLNIFSVAGFYGNTARRKAKWLQKNGFYSFSGTDLHRLSVLNSFLGH